MLERYEGRPLPRANDETMIQLANSLAGLPDTALQVLACRFPPDEIATKTRAIYEAVLQRSAHMKVGNFTTCAPSDLALLFDLYDTEFFGGSLGRLLRTGAAPLSFDFSSRLTRSAGLTKRFAPRARTGQPAPPASRYEIVLSTSLLFQTFTDVERTVRVNGVVCNDRLEAAQRVFEHEVLHLIEMLVWGNSSCDAGRYKDLALHMFAHTQTRHDLVTQQERARSKFDVRVGDRVTFTFEGRTQTGVVNRITRRVTVLVEDEQGTPYNDGKKYQKYYIPLTMLRKSDA